jgi:hypothetical protein
MFISNSKFYVKSTISSTQGTWTTFNISEDFETGQHIDSDWEVLSIVLKTSTQIERLTITCVWWVATIVKRWLTQWDTKVEQVWLQKQWTDWTIWYVTALASDLLDIDRAWWVSVLSNNIDFTWEVEFKWPTRWPTFADTTARDLVYTSPVNSDECFIVWVWKQVYNGWAWVTLDEWTPTPNASTTVAWKLEIATDSEITAWTNTWWTWAPLSITPTQLKKSISLKTAWTTFWDTDEISVNISWEDFKITWANLRKSIPASETLKGTVQRASNAEATAGTNNTKFMTPELTKDSIKDCVSTSFTSKAFDTVHWPTTEAWFVIASRLSGSWVVWVYWLIWSTSTPTLPAGWSSWFSPQSWAICFIVPKGWYYRVNRVTSFGWEVENMNFIPLR